MSLDGEDGEGAGSVIGPGGSSPVKFVWTFERVIEVFKLVIVTILGSIFAFISGLPKWVIDSHQADVASLSTTNPDSNLVVKKICPTGDGKYLYDVFYEVSVKNNTENKVKITYSIAQMYTYDPSQISRDQLDRGFRIDDVPQPSFVEKGPVEGQFILKNGSKIFQEQYSWSDNPKKGWALNAVDASYIEGNPPNDVRQFFERNFTDDTRAAIQRGASIDRYLSPGGGLTGIIAPGQDSATNVRFLIRARPDQYIGLVVTYGIDDTIVSPSPLLNLTSDFQRFSEADENRAAETAEAGLCASPAKNRDKTNQRSPPRSRKAN